MAGERYLTFWEGKFSRMRLQEVAHAIYLPEDTKISEYSNDFPFSENVWSARTATGLFGLTSCISGNKGPRGQNEVILGIGYPGLREIINLGFISCGTCHPEKIPGFWDSIKDIARKKNGISTLENFLDRQVLPRDVRRIDWETLLPMIGETPGMLYLPNGLSDDELRGLKVRFSQLGFNLPKRGYFDHKKGETIEYKILGEK